MSKNTRYTGMGTKGSEKYPVEKLRWYAARGFDRHQIAAIYKANPQAIALKCKKYNISLLDRRAGIPAADRVEPTTPSVESPITPALIRLAKHDPLAARALRRKMGELEDDPNSPEED